MEKRLLFAFNPQAGKGEIRQKLLPVVQIFNEGGYDVTVRPTRQGGELPLRAVGAPLQALYRGDGRDPLPRRERALQVGARRAGLRRRGGLPPRSPGRIRSKRTMRLYRAPHLTDRGPARTGFFARF